MLPAMPYFHNILQLTVTTSQEKRRHPQGASGTSKQLRRVQSVKPQSARGAAGGVGGQLALAGPQFSPGFKSCPAFRLPSSLAASLHSVSNRHFPASTCGFEHKNGINGLHGDGSCWDFCLLFCSIPFQVQSSVYLLGFHPFSQKKKFPRVPNGLLIGATRKETPRPVTPIHRTQTHARAQTQPHARLPPSSPPGGELRPAHRSQQAGERGAGSGERGAGRSHSPGASGPGAAWSRAFSSGSGKVGIHRLGASVLISPNVTASAELQQFKCTIDVPCLR